MNRPVPVTFRVFVEWLEHDGQYRLNVVADEIAEILVVPEVKCALGYLDLTLGCSVLNN